MSNINPTNINDAYPGAGVDNDSQGFRDNFKNIKTNFSFASTEIADLQSKVVLKTALNNTTLNNNFSGSILSGAEVRDFRETSFDNGVVSSTVILDHSSAHYQRVTTSGNGTGITIGFSNVPAAGKIGRFRLKLQVQNSADFILLPASVNKGLRYVPEYDSSNNSLRFNDSGTGFFYFEFLTDDAGTSFSCQDITRGAVYSDYTVVSNLSNNFNVTLRNSKLILDSSNHLVNVGNIYLPSNPKDGQFVQIITGVYLGNLAIKANTSASTTVLGTLRLLNANTYVGYTYVASTNRWYPSAS